MNKKLLTNDTSPAQDDLRPGSMHQDPENRYPSGERQAYAGGTIQRNDSTDWDRVTSNRSQFGNLNPLTQHMLSKMDERPATGAERTNDRGNPAWDRTKEVVAAANDKLMGRVDTLKQGMAGSREYPDTQGDLDKGTKLNPSKAVTRQAY